MVEKGYVDGLSYKVSSHLCGHHLPFKPLSVNFSPWTSRKTDHTEKHPNVSAVLFVNCSLRVPSWHTTSQGSNPMGKYLMLHCYSTSCCTSAVTGYERDLEQDWQLLFSSLQPSRHNGECEQVVDLKTLRQGAYKPLPTPAVKMEAKFCFCYKTSHAVNCWRSASLLAF